MKDLIKQILKEETNVPIYFRRRIDSHKFEKIMKNDMMYSYLLTSCFDGFKNEILYSTLEKYLKRYHDEIINDVNREDVLKYLNHLESVFGDLIKMYYKNLRKNIKE